MKNLKELFGDFVNLLLFLAGILLIALLLLFFDQTVKRWVVSLLSGS
jgi:hypothetical protein